MSLAQFAIFTAVAKHLNVTKAAEELHISQPAISRQLKLLQEIYGVKLYSRDARGIQLTKAGRIFLKDSKAILSRLNDLKRKFSNSQKQERNSVLVVGGSSGPTEIIVPSLLAVFEKSHPLTQIDLRIKDNRTVERLVLNSEVEIAIITGRPHSPRLAAEPFSEEEVVAFVSARHPIIKKSKLTLDEFASAPLVIRRSEGDVAETEKSLKKLEKLKNKGLNFKVIMWCESSSAVKSAVEAGVGVGLLTRSSVALAAKRGDIKLLKLPDLGLRVRRFIVYRKDQLLSFEAREFLALLRAHRSHPVSPGTKRE